MHDVVLDELLPVSMLIVLVERYSQICLCMPYSSLLVLAKHWWRSSTVGNRGDVVGGWGVAWSEAEVWVILGDVDIGWWA